MRIVHFLRLLFRHWPGKLDFQTTADLARIISRTFASRPAK